ncbi:hypothetical protein GTP91_15265 [Rugamonas sp. FT82W]|uniref:Uncharacterized protein n=1 Tax=Duganella vulcania TaxID=2692166 RepID=A0A845G6N3_9BURK|nr:YwqJ-related putative deaminase [Duganella vulcania]MYM88529.1 hypothetical protein [Duganella vulcania]
MNKRRKNVPQVSKSKLKQAAKAASSGAPKLAEQVDCQLSKKAPITRVMPQVTVADSPGFYHQDRFHPAQLELRILEQGDGPQYQGTGSVAADVDSAALFTGPDCQVLMNQPLTAAALRNGVPCYVKGGQTGPVTVQLSLTASDDPSIEVVQLAADAVEIEPVNVITAVIAGDTLALQHDGLLNAYATTLSEISISLEQSNPGRCCDDLAFRVGYADSATCFRAGGQNPAFPTATTVLYSEAGPTLTLRVKGLTQGACEFRARAVGTAGPGWMFADDTLHSLWVERLLVQAYMYRDGDLFDGAQDAMADGGPPRERWLHQSDGDIFTLARCRMQAPGAEFWNRASAVTLEADAGSTLFLPGPPIANIVSFDQAAFAQGPVDFLVRTAVADPIAAQPAALVNVAVTPPYPAAAERPSHVSCGATLLDGGKQLRFGDVVKMRTYSFDYNLDQLVQAEAFREIKAPVKLKEKGASACAEAHRLYEKASALYTNQDMGNQQTAFNDFIAELRSGLNPAAAGQAEFYRINPAAMAKKGQEHVSTVLFPTVLAPAMEARIESYFLTVITNFRADAKNANKPNFGFNVNYGIPGAHAECLAVNELLRDNIAATAITVATYKLGPGPMKGKRFVACANCNGILLQANSPVRVITDNG